MSPAHYVGHEKMDVAFVRCCHALGVIAVTGDEHRIAVGRQYLLNETANHCFVLHEEDGLGTDNGDWRD